MKRTIKVIAGAVIAVLVMAALVAAVALFLADRKFNRVIPVAVQAVPYAGGDEVIRRGQYLFETRGCAECHGADGNGRLLADGRHGMYIKTPNLTIGAGGVASRYREVDWVRTIRQGVKPDGRPLRIMPAETFNRLTDADLAAIVAYVRSLPPGDGSGAEIHLPLMFKVLYGLGVIKDAEQRIDHSLPPSTPVPEGPSVEYGEYVANMCIGCHGQGFSGGRIPGGPPDWPAAANLTPGMGSVMPRYANLAMFKAMLRSGRRPDGSEVSKVMPFASLAALSDNDVEAVYVFLKALPPRAVGRH
jgi:mono/diheme cytochrome c family protein